MHHSTAIKRCSDNNVNSEHIYIFWNRINSRVDLAMPVCPYERRDRRNRLKDNKAAPFCWCMLPRRTLTPVNRVKLSLSHFWKCFDILSYFYEFCKFLSICLKAFFHFHFNDHKPPNPFRLTQFLNFFHSIIFYSKQHSELAWFYCLQRAEKSHVCTNAPFSLNPRLCSPHIEQLFTL